MARVIAPAILVSATFMLSSATATAEGYDERYTRNKCHGLPDHAAVRNGREAA
jgi:hypothetical protein